MKLNREEYNLTRNFDDVNIVINDFMDTPLNLPEEWVAGGHCPYESNYVCNETLLNGLMSNMLKFGTLHFQYYSDKKKFGALYQIGLQKYYEEGYTLSEAISMVFSTTIAIEIETAKESYEDS